MGLRRYNRDDMNIKQLATQVTYKIEANPAGGFIARSTDPSIAPIEAPTVEELQKKIQERLMGSIGALLPGSSLPTMLAKVAAAGATTITRTVTTSTSDGNTIISREASPEEVKQFAMQFAGIMQKDFPELAQELSAKVAAAPSPLSPNSTNLQISSESGSNMHSDGFPQNAANNPILPETNGLWRFVAICAVALALALAFLLYAHR